MTFENSGPAPAQDMASALYGLPGLRVVEAEDEADGTFTVRAVPEAEPRCQGCGRLASVIHEHVTAAAKDVRCGGRPARLRVHKTRLECGSPACPVATFTERVPDLPLRCRITSRLKGEAGTGVADRGVTPAKAGPARGRVLADRP